MASSSAILRELHRLHRFARELKDQIDRGPRQLKAQDDRIARFEAARTEAQDSIKKLKVKIHEKEVETKTKQQQIAKYEQQRNQAANRKEYDAFQHEIAHAKLECQKLEDATLEIMEEAENLSGKLPELEKAVSQARDEAARFRKDYEPRVLVLREQFDKATLDLKEQEKLLPPAMLESYDRLVTSMGEDALSLVVNRSCTACHTSITIQHQNDLLSGRLVLCKSCGRMLYVEEQPPRDNEA
jgi:predicted  nucleic acid-binding Zn-ribbon protein